MTLGRRYEIRAALGRGGMGLVFEADQTDLGRVVAIKILAADQIKKSTSMQRFQNEARTAGVVSHPNICAVYDIGTAPNGAPFLVMERLYGEPLSLRIAKREPLPFAFCIAVAMDMLSGLEASHRKQVIHRDIKPENVFLCDRPRRAAKLVDFGVSKFLSAEDEDDDSLSLTRTGMVMGTPYYMSAEQARGMRDLDQRVDVYATGVVLYEMITGSRPFRAPNYNALLMQIVTTAPPPMTTVRPGVPAELVTVVETAMHRNRDKRYPGAAEFKKALQQSAIRLGLRPSLDLTAKAVPPPPATLPLVSPKHAADDDDDGAVFDDGPTRIRK
jgi:eukaryotic-like serine/threonine-protein kinase